MSIKIPLILIVFSLFLFTFLLFPASKVKASAVSDWLDYYRGRVLGDDDDSSKKDDDKKDEDKKKKKEKEKERKGAEKREKKTEEKIQNADGSETRIKREFKDGEEKVEIKTYNRFGNKTQELKFENDSKEIKLEIEDEGSDDSISGSIKRLNLGDRLSEMSLSTANGRKLDLKVKSGDEEGRMRFNPEDGKLTVRRKIEKKNSENDDEIGAKEVESVETEEETEVEIDVDNNGFTLKSRGSVANIHFPISVDAESGEIYVDTPSGQVLLKTMPDSILEKIKANRDNFTVDSFDVDINNTTEDSESISKLEYKVKGRKIKRLLGLFKVGIDEQVTLDDQTGEVISSNATSIRSRLLDLFSF